MTSKIECQRWYNDKVSCTSYKCTKLEGHKGNHSHFGKFDF